MSLEPITAALNALSSLKPGDLILDALNPSLREQIAHEYKLAEADMQEFLEALLRGDLDLVNLKLRGLRSAGPLPRATSAECQRLVEIRPSIDGGTLLGLYVQAREGDYFSAVSGILSVAHQEKK